MNNNANSCVINASMSDSQSDVGVKNEHMAIKACHISSQDMALQSIQVRLNCQVIVHMLYMLKMLRKMK